MLQIKITNRSFEKYFYALFFDAKLIDRLQLDIYLITWVLLVLNIQI